MNRTNLYKNVALLQINVQSGVDEYYLAKNMDWQDKVIDRIVLFAPKSSGMLSPIDGSTPVLTQSQLDSLYLDLFGDDQKTIANALAATALLHDNNHPFTIGHKLQWNMSRMFFTNTPGVNGCVLLYMFYESKAEYDYEMPQRSITIEFPLDADQEITFTRLINTYLHAPAYDVKGITFWDADNNPAYLTLRDHNNTYVINNLATPMCRPQMIGSDAQDTQIRPLLLDSLDIDFDNSYIRNATSSAQTQKMTIKY